VDQVARIPACDSISAEPFRLTERRGPTWLAATGVRCDHLRPAAEAWALDGLRENPMDTNPYAPPKAAVADLSSTGLRRRSVLLMIVFAVVTFGLYYPIWFLRRRAALNRLDSPRKLQAWPFVVVIAWFVFQIVLGAAASSETPEETFGEGTVLLLNVVQLAVGILMLVQSFVTKDILEDHLAGPGDQVPSRLLAEAVKLSGVMTFFFQIFYLQYVINRDIAGSKPSAV
jgi:hypothetical protein